MNETLLRPNILEHICQNLSYYLSYHDWFLQYLVAMSILWLLYKLSTYNNKTSYSALFPVSIRSQPINTLVANSFLGLCIIIYIICLYTQELSFFANYDTMGPNTMRILQQGVTPFWGLNGRFSPVAFWDINIVYAITHNFTVINTYILIQTFVITFLLNKLLDFIPRHKRLTAIGLFIITPAFLWTNNIIYPERMLIIYILSALLFLKKYIKQNNNISLWYCIIFINLSLYTKESCALFYLGILLYSFIQNLLQEKITTTSFIHPLKTIRQFPIEMLIFASLLIFSLFYLHNVFAITSSPYMSLRTSSVDNAIRTYGFELSIIALAVGFWIYAICRRQSFFFSNAVMCGCLCFVCTIIFVLKLVPFSSQMENKTYYMLIPCAIGIISLTIGTVGKYTWIVCAAFIFSGAIYKNYNIAAAEEGKYYRQTALFLNNQNKHTLNIFISKHSEPLSWWIAVWSALYKYYWPEKKIKFISPLLKPQHNLNDLQLTIWNREAATFHPMTYQDMPQTGDFYVIKKTKNYQSDKDAIKTLPHDLSFSNNLFEVYEIQ